MPITKSYQRHGETILLEESDSLFVIRTKNGFPPQEILSFCLKKNVCEFHDQLDSFPEASVWVFKLNQHSTLSIIDLKTIVISNNHPELIFIGSVWIDVETRRYQLYTENLFVKFLSSFSDTDCRSLLDEWGIDVKIKLDFSKNTFFIEPRDSTIIDTFSWNKILNDKDEVETCEPELIVKRKSFKSSKTTNILDPDRKWAKKAVGLYEAWEVSKGKDVKICIIDDGIDTNHPAFNKLGKIHASRDMLKKENTNAMHLYNSEIHGTACASIASSGDYRSFGIAPESQLIIVRSKGLGSILEAEAIHWGVNQGADVISCSWGPSDGDIDDPTDDFPSHRMPEATRLAIDYAVNKGRNGKGTLMFFAAGNGNEAISLDSYASYDNVLAIGAVNKKNERSVYSDHGAPLFCVFPSSEMHKTTNGYETSYGITVADRLGVDGYTDNDYYSQFGGTSASAPGAAGIAALALSIKPKLTASELKNILKHSCRKIGNSENYDSNGYSHEYGYGLLCANLTINNTIKFSKMNDQLKTTKTPKGYALHIGVDNTGPGVYTNFSPLSGCVNDAKALKSITEKEQFDEIVLLADSDAKRDRIKEVLSFFADKAIAGDLVVITYAGHGSQIPDTNGDEISGFDQVLVTYDGFLIDDEIYDLFLNFNEGVRVVWVGDSCHADTQVRAATSHSSIVKTRDLDDQTVKAFYEKNKIFFDKISAEIIGKGRENAKASILNMYACQKYELAQEFNGRGLFTQSVEILYNSGNIFTIQEAIDQLKKPLNRNQEPNVEFFGKNPQIFNRGVFKIAEDRITSLPKLSKENEMNKAAEEEVQSSPNQGTTLLVSTSKDQLELIDSNSGGKSKAIRVANSEVISETMNKVNSWDNAYDLYHSLKNKEDVDFIEPDFTSDIYKIYDEDLQGKRAANKYLDSYPDPEHDKFNSLKNPFIWHLGEDYSQLKNAFNLIRKTFKTGEPTLEERADLPLICHIDTGILDDHPATPKFLDFDKSRTFRTIGKKKDITDNDSKTSIIENQGHGQGTLSILAGNYVNLEDTNNAFEGYYGAFPYAKVMSLKISENVVLLSANKFARALRYAVDQGCDVVTMSMAGAPSKTMVKAINYAYDNGVVVVSAAGNSWTKGGRTFLPKKTMYPARFNRVIGVTGATLDYTPYLVKENENWRTKTRDTGGLYMQTCFGPQSASRTNMAGYTPNVQWASNFKNNSYFDKSGGGTSSATPQVAAAAAMWLYVHRESLQTLLEGKRDWQRVEMVRTALFSTAKKGENKSYNEVFGNGMLKAFDALSVTPESFKKNEISMEDPDSLGWTGLDEFFKQLSNRSKKTSNDQIKEMVQTELQQLCCVDPLFFDFDENATLDDMGEAIIASEKASSYLKSLATGYAQIKLSDSERSSENIGSDMYVSSKLKTDGKGEFHIRAEGCAFELIEQDSTEDSIYAEYELVISPTSNRGLLGPRINFRPNEKASPALLVEEYEDGLRHYKWILPEESINQTRGLPSYNDHNEFTLDITSSNSRGKGKVKKFFVKIFRTFKDKALSDRPGLIVGHISGNKFQWITRTDKIDQAITKQKKTLLLLHGTFSSAESSFSDLLEQPDFFTKLKDNSFGQYVLAYNMSTIRSSVSDNASDLLKALKPLGVHTKANKTLEIIASSRGCLVARKTFGNELKMALVAGTHLGTPLASAEHISTLVNRISNLAALSFGPNVFAGFLKGLSKVVGVVFKAKGISDQDEDSKLVNELAKTPLNTLQLVVGSNLEPNAKILKQLGDEALDRLVFGNRHNDGVTLLNSALIDEGQGAHEPFYMDPLGETSHFGYFRNEEVINAILEHFLKP